MSRYIDADILSDALRHLTLGETDVARATMKITHYVSRMPTADVRENVRGEWITPTEKMYSMDGEDITFAYKECNRCHKVYVRTNDNFCPNCGAQMRGDKT